MSNSQLSDRIRLVSYRFAHHSDHSGYDMLCNYLGETIQVSPLPKTIIRDRIIWKIAGPVENYDRLALAGELKVAWSMLRQPDRLYHFIYGENSYQYLGHINNLRGNKLIATYHLPPSNFADHVSSSRHLTKLSAIVCVGTNQLEYFSNIIGPDKVFYVPLGVDTSFFRPPEKFDDRDPDLCLCVGFHLRDYPTFRGAIELVHHFRPKTRFMVVGDKRLIPRLGVHPAVELASNIPENTLLKYYQTASLFILPLIDQTANCALLEAMACGVPTIATGVGGIHDYVGRKGAYLIPPNDSRKMAFTIMDLLDQRDELRRMSLDSRNQVEQFNWPEIARKMMDVYAAIE